MEAMKVANEAGQAAGNPFFLSFQPTLPDSTKVIATVIQNGLIEL